MNNLFETLVNQMGYVHNRTDDNLKGRFLSKIKCPNGDEELKTLTKGKEMTDRIQNDFLLKNFHLGMAKDQSDNDILPAISEITNDAHM